ncbi:uncharacterized protein L201_000236 [Kwoniella dendrophila CBS 6074]|uniref:Uncharacterized protein n=1 Tax=Kwoniella dendrophila CBS 6074 TaxID=1295534 RepID=A0AAX4JKH9_9TREE
MLRVSRNTAIRLNRTSSSSSLASPQCIIGSEASFPHAESSSAPSRRYNSSLAQSTDSSTTNSAATSSSLKGKERRQFKPNSRIKKQALANARKLAAAIQSERNTAALDSVPPKSNFQPQSQISSTTPSQPTANSAEASSSSSTSNSDSSDSFWSDILTKPTTSTSTNGTEAISSTSTSAALAGSTGSASSPETKPTFTRSGTTLTLDDLLLKKPERDPPDPWHPKYEKLYKRLYKSIESAFILRQLRWFTAQLNIYVSPKGGKGGAIRAIMESWNWPQPREKSPQELPQPMIFDLPSPELFLFLRDYELIESLSKGYDRLYFSVLPLSQASEYSKSLPLLDPGKDQERMVLLATGRVAQLTDLRGLLATRRAAIQNIEIPSSEVNGLNAPAGLLQTVSNATGAYVESISDEKYRITAMSLEDAEDAKRLLAMASLRTHTLTSHRSLDVLLPTPRNFQAQPLKLSLYPFQPSLTESIPWSISSMINDKTLFRLKKITEWNSKPAIREIDHKNEKLNIARYLNLFKPNSNSNEKQIETDKGGNEIMNEEEEENSENLEDIQNQFQFQNLIQNLSVKKGRRRVKVVFGNLLFPVNSKDSNKLGTFDNPLPGLWSIETIQKWLSSTKYSNDRKPIFTPSLTPSMIQFPLTNSQTKEIRRIRYRSLPNSDISLNNNNESRFVQFTYTKPEINGNNWQGRLDEMLGNIEKEIEQEDNTTIPVVKDNLELQAAKVDEGMTTTDSDQVQDNVSASEHPEHGSTIVQKSEEGITKSFEAEFGVIKESDLFIPDRPNDARIESTSTQTLPLSKIPDSINHLFEMEQSSSSSSSTNTTSTLLPPSRLFIKDEEYQLEFDEKVEIQEEIKEIQVSGNSLNLITRSLKVIENGLGDNVKPLTYSEIACGSNPYGALPIEFYRELAFITRDVGPDAGVLKRGNIFAGLGLSANWNSTTAN